MSDNNFFVLSSGIKVPVIIETRRGIRNVTLRPKTNPNMEIHISKPYITSEKFVLNFLESKRRWVEYIFSKAPQKQTLKPNDTIEFLGKNVLLLHDENMRGNKYIDSDKMNLCIGGGLDMFERRVRDFIKNEFLESVKEIVKQAPKEFWPKKITLRDTTSRWGSCSSTGTISLSWRLAFAPYDVMRYVVCHEMAHRQHMDHSPEFWHAVSQLYGFGVERSKRWLVKNGGELHKYF
ncbi:MAG: DUF45 domain-containing protein [Alphaproteobacteria bacterium]|nr:DUF45 domain-containing protein [Alphaproteobacteria bacterium]